MLARNAVLVALALTWAAVLLRVARFPRPRSILIAAWALGFCAWLALGLALLARGLGAGRWPMTNRYEFALWLGWLALAIQLEMDARRAGRDGGSAAPAALAVAAASVTYAVLQPASDRILWPLLPALDSIWLPVHVFASAVAYAGCLVAGSLAAFQLLRPRRVDATGLLPEQDLGRSMERTLALAFPWMSASLLTGAIWAQNAWGSYWGWDPKESWALITWLWYLLLLHLRGHPGWQGKRRMAMVLAGLGLVMFTFAGLPWFVRTVRLETLHAF